MIGGEEDDDAGDSGAGRGRTAAAAEGEVLAVDVPPDDVARYRRGVAVVEVAADVVAVGGKSNVDRLDRLVRGSSAVKRGAGESGSSAM